jgi:hypothetical protein
MTSTSMSPTLWHDYGPTLAAEELSRAARVAMSRETLRK